MHFYFGATALPAHHEMPGNARPTAAAYSNIDLREIAELERATADLIAIAPQAKTVLADVRLADLTHAFGIVAQHVRSLPNLAALLRGQGSDPKRLLEISRVCAALMSCEVAATDLAAIKSFSLEKLATLNSVIEQIEALRVSMFGYLFAGKGLQKAAKILRDECKIETDKPQHQLSKLKTLRNLAAESAQQPQSRFVVRNRSARAAWGVYGIKLGHFDAPDALRLHRRIFRPKVGKFVAELGVK